MSKKILDVVEAVSYEMDVPKEVIFKAIETALAIATKKRYLGDVDIKVVIDRETGDYESFRCWTVVQEGNIFDENGEPIEFDSDRHIFLEQAKKQDQDLEVGDMIQEPITSIEFGRIAAQLMKQVITQEIRKAKQEQIAEECQEKLGKLVTGTVKRTIHDSVIVDLGHMVEAIILKSELLPNDILRPGDRIRAYLYEIKTTTKGTQLYLSRTRKEMLTELFRLEVPEIGEDIIEIKAVAREPGVRSKIAVKTNDGRIDPVGACVGMRGARVQVISNELKGERVDIVLWDDNPAQLAINAMAPAEILSITVDEEKHAMDITVDPEKLSQAIGRSGANIKLASELTGWTLNVMTPDEAKAKVSKEVENYRQEFIDKLDIDEEIADILVREGFTSIEEIAYVPIEELTDIEEFDEDIVNELRDRAKAIVAKEEALLKPSEELLNMKGMTKKLAKELAKHGVKTMEDLAEQSVDDLRDIVDISEDRAGELIMTAREPWFQ
ncbi:MAG: transcription termination/antitermination protein NusA [Gammaproteobacteria bacterium]|nr:transcription termination/antitermination protein NusA [Gammaproteobacteria bacterium]